jgi:hypothetical protein
MKNFPTVCVLFVIYSCYSQCHGNFICTASSFSVSFPRPHYCVSKVTFALIVCILIFVCESSFLSKFLLITLLQVCCIISVSRLLSEIRYH